MTKYWTESLKKIDNDKASILLISITNPIPQSTGGARGVAHSVLPLVDQYNFHLLIVGNQEMSDQMKSQLKNYRDYFCSVSFVKREDIPHNLLLRGSYFLKRLLWELPFLDINFYSSYAIKVAGEIIKKYNIDILELHTTHVAYFKYFFPGVPSLLMSHNIESELFPFWDRPCPKPLRPFYNYLVRKSRTSSYEVEIFNKWNIEKMAFVTPEDMAKVSSSINKTVLSISFDDISRPKKAHSTFNVVWVGTFDWGPNVASMEWFADNVFPRIKEELEKRNICIKIIGIHPTEKILKLAQHPCVSVPGFVEDLNAILDEADLSIAPIVSGAGIKVKVLEAMNRGIPLLSTNMGVIGTGLKNNVSAFVTDDPIEFAQYLLTAQDDQERLKKYSLESKKIFNENFNRSKALKHKKEIYDELLSIGKNSNINRERRHGLPPLYKKAFNKLKREIKAHLPKFPQRQLVQKGTEIKEEDKNFGIQKNSIDCKESPYYGLTPLKPLDSVLVFDEDFRETKLSISFSVVICVKNEEKNLPKLFMQLERQTCRPNEIIFIDHFSTDSTRELINSYNSSSRFKVSLHSSKESSQFKKQSAATLAGNRNFGLQLADSTYVLFTDAGNEIDDNFFLNLVGVAQRDKSIDLVGGIYRTQSKILDEQFTYKWDQVDFKNFIPACRAMLVKKELALSCGGFLEPLSYACEDVCFCLSYRKMSKKWAFNRKAQVIWDAPESVEELWKKFTSYGIGGGEAGYADFDNYQYYSYFHFENNLPPELLNLKILPPFFFGYLMGRSLKGEFDRRLGLKKIVLFFIDNALYFSSSSRSLLKQQADELSRIIVISQNNPKEYIWEKEYLEANCWQIELVARKDFSLESLISRYGFYFTNKKWEILLDSENSNDGVKEYAERISKKIETLFAR